MIWELHKIRISTIPRETISKIDPMLGLFRFLQKYFFFQSIYKSSFWNTKPDSNWLIDINYVKDKQGETEARCLY